MVHFVSFVLLEISIVSPKHSSLAIDIKEEQDEDHEFTPELTLIINERNRSESNKNLENPVRITGFVTISF